MIHLGCNFINDSVLAAFVASRAKDMRFKLCLIEPHQKRFVEFADSMAAEMGGYKANFYAIL